MVGLMMVASPFVSVLFSTLVQKLSSLVEEEATKLLNVERELQDLLRKMKKITYVVTNAEQKALDMGGPIRLWLAELRDALYDIDDIADECRIRGQLLTPSKATGNTSSDALPLTTTTTTSAPAASLSRFKFKLPSCLRSVKSRHEIGNMIKEVNQKLEQIAKEKKDYGLLNPLLNNYVPQSKDYGQMETTHEVPLDVVGKEIEMESFKIVWMLMDRGVGNHGVFPEVIAIVGMVGVGKTTLAQMVFNHSSVAGNGVLFEKRLWVFVPRIFEGKSMLRNIAREASGDPCQGAESKDELSAIVRKAVHGRNILLVLDDVNSSKVWDEWLKTPLAGSGNGSRVIITTRSEQVANEMCASYIHKMKVMSESDALSMLYRNSFGNTAGEEHQGELEEVAKKIVSKCEYLPLAIKAIGRVLRTKPKRRSVWEAILCNNVWSAGLSGSDVDAADQYGDSNQVMGALYVGYRDLDARLKQCFAYCSLFPDDHQFHMFPFGEYWVAEDFLGFGDGPGMESMVEKLFNELCNRNLLMENFSGAHWMAKRIHGMLHHLATQLTKDENFFGVRGDLDNRSVRRASFVNETSLEDYDPSKHHARLRTLMLLKSPELKEIPKDLFQKLRYLRVLSLNGTGIGMLPETIKYLVHLRHFDLSHTPITSLPEQLCDLRSLMFLILQSCSNLRALSDGIVRLQNLRKLDTHMTKIDRMPKMIRQLEKLQTLVWRLEEGENAGAQGQTMEELAYLKNLTCLTLENLERLQSIQTTRDAKLAEKPHLVSLYLRCDPSKRLSEENVKMLEMVFEELHPPRCVQDLHITGFLVDVLPTWMSPEKLPELGMLFMKDLPSCLQLPSFGQWPHLQKLVINHACRVASLGSTFFTGNGQTFRRPFPELELLVLHGMHNLRDCCCEAASFANVPSPFPRLWKLTVGDCPFLKSLWGCLSLALSLRELHLENLPRLEAIPELPALHKLNVDNCPAVKGCGMLKSLQDLHWSDERNETTELSGLEIVLPRAPQLQITIIKAISLRAIQCLLPCGTYWNYIETIPRLYAWKMKSSFFLQFSKSPQLFRAFMPEGYYDFSQQSLQFRPFNPRPHVTFTFQGSIVDTFIAAAKLIFPRRQHCPVHGESGNSDQQDNTIIHQLPSSKEGGGVAGPSFIPSSIGQPSISQNLGSLIGSLSSQLNTVQKLLEELKNETIVLTGVAEALCRVKDALLKESDARRKADKTDDEGETAQIDRGKGIAS